MNYFENFELTAYNSYRIKSYCKRAFFPNNVGDLINIYKQNPNSPKIILGNGNNIILSKEFYYEDFIFFNGNFNNIALDKSEIIAEAGCTTQQLSELALKHGLSGAEIFYDIPSSIGGAVVMNAGASGEEIKDILVKVRFLDLVDMKAKEIFSDEIGFEYRNSFFQKNTNKIVLKAWFRLTPEEPVAIKERMENIKLQRWAKQPRKYPNAGSVFKRPKGFYVGAMIEQLGLKGFQTGGAKVSEKHGGFIINTGNATGKDIITLIKYIQQKVNENFGVELEIEQRII